MTRYQWMDLLVNEWDQRTTQQCAILSSLKYFILQEKILFLPDGTSTEHIGTLTLLIVSITVSKGDLILPLKLNPNIASTISLYVPSICDFVGISVRKGMSMRSHCVVKFVKSSLEERFG